MPTARVTQHDWPISITANLCSKHSPETNLHLRSRCQRSRWSPGLPSPARLDTASCPSPLEKRQSWWDHLKQTRWQTGHSYHHHWLTYIHSYTLCILTTFEQHNVVQTFWDQPTQISTSLSTQVGTDKGVYTHCMNQCSQNADEYFLFCSACIYTQSDQLSRTHIVYSVQQLRLTGALWGSLSGRLLTCWTCWPRDTTHSEKGCVARMDQIRQEKRTTPSISHIP